MRSSMTKTTTKPVSRHSVRWTVTTIPLLGDASRKLGRYDDAKVWYERALTAVELNRREVPAPKGGQWHALTVMRLRQRLAA
jgi:hypothetical protein